MGNTERRKYSRFEIEIEATILQKDEKIPATLIDISKGGVGLISERKIFPGTKVEITVNHIDNYAIYGTVRWMQPTSKEGRTQYRIGIEADQILVPEYLGKDVLPERAE